MVSYLVNMATSHSSDISQLFHQCDKEPIHIPGAIQPHGYLLAADKDNLSIKYISKNWEELLGKDVRQLLKQPLSTVLGQNIHLTIKEFLSEQPTDCVRPSELAQWQYGKAGFNVLFHVQEQLIILELEPLKTQLHRPSFHWLDRYQNLISQISLQEMLGESAREIRRLAGYDRVMIYRFHPDMHGEVVAEAKRSDLESFLGLHYPATDIPKQARQLYLTNWTRLLVNVNYAAVPLLTHESYDRPLDMSLSTLRSVSPVHVKYLQNMGVSATLTISIIYQGQLWGLIACHHYQPKFVNFQTRSTCELIGRLLSLYLPEKEQKEIKSAISTKEEQLLRIVEQMEKKNDFVKGLIINRHLLSLFDHVDGAAVIFQDVCHLLGNTPDESSIRRFIEWYEKNRKNENPFFNHQLSHDCPKAGLSGQAQGVLLLRIYEHKSVYIIWFRPEYQHHIHWAGNPEKAVKADNGVLQLSPRESFRQFLETVAGQALPWSMADIALAKKLGYMLRDKLLDIQQAQLSDTQALFRMIYEQSSDALFLSDFQQRKILDCNQKAVELFEAESKQMLINSSGAELHAADKEKKQQEHSYILAELAQKNEVTLDVQYRTLQGNTFWGRFTAKVLQGSLQQLHIVRVTDISQSKRHAEELKRQNEELQKVNQELDRFVYSASHDLRAPISSLLGLLQVAESMDDVKEILKYLELGKKSLYRLDHFIQEILDYSRNSRLEVKKVAVDLQNLISEVLENYAYVESYQKISKEVQVRGDFSFYSDTFRLKVILNNLLSNALRYSLPREELSYVRVTADISKWQAVITVSDNGMGIREHHLSRIFDMFYRADSLKAGSGLGLYIVKETLAKLGGSIEVTSEFEKGTTFRLVIPNELPAIEK